MTVVPRRVHTRRGERAGRDYPFAHAKPPQGCPPRHSASYLLAPPEFRLNRRRPRSSDSTQTNGPAKSELTPTRGRSPGRLRTSPTRPPNSPRGRSLGHASPLALSPPHPT